MASFSTLQEPFISANLNTNLWTQVTAGSATMSYGNGASVVYPASTTATTDGDLTSVNTYDLTGTSAFINILSVASGAAVTDNSFRLITGSSHVGWLFEAGSLYCQQVVSGVATNLTNFTYNATTHAWWKIRETAGTTFWETSADSLTWTTRFSVTNPITLTALTVKIAGTAFSTGSSPGNFSFRYLNIPNGDGLPNAILPIKAGGMSAGMASN